MRRYLLVFLWIGLNSLQLLAQKTYPVKATLVLKAPHSPYISDYIEIDNNPLTLTLLNQNTSFSGEIVFRLSIKGVGITIQSNNTGSVPVSVPQGAPVILSGSDLASYFVSSNLSFSGYSKNQYDQKGVLPEGLYEFSFQAFDARRNDIAVSNVASFMCWIQLHDPPQLIFPKNQSTVESKIPQQVSFQWQGTTLTNVSYELELYELRVTDKRDPNEVIRGIAPIFTTTTYATTYIYSVNDPPLIDGMNYAWRIRAKIYTEKELIKNQGYSATFTFTYLPTCKPPSLIKSSASKNKTALLTWAGEGKEYLIQYREEGQSDWYEELSLTESLTISQLRPGKKYEYRIKSICEYNYSNYTAIDTFSIPNSNNLTPLTPPAKGYPEIVLDKSTYLEHAAEGMMIKVNYFEMKIIKAIKNEQTKLWTGQGTMYIPSWRANVLVEFRDIHINAEQILVAGHVHGVRAPKPKTTVKLPAIKQVKTICLTYGPDGYDEDGYDKNGYDRDGYNKEGRDKDGYDEYGYNAQNIDRNGQPKQTPSTNPTQGNPTTSTGTNGNNSTQTGTGGNNTTQTGTNAPTNPVNIANLDEKGKQIHKALSELKEESEKKIKDYREKLEKCRNDYRKIIKDENWVKWWYTGKDELFIKEGISQDDKINFKSQPFIGVYLKAEDRKNYEPAKLKLLDKWKELYELDLTLVDQLSTDEKLTHYLDANYFPELETEIKKNIEVKKITAGSAIKQEITDWIKNAQKP